MILFYIYLITLIIGGVLLLFTLFLGGSHDSGLGHDVDIHHDVELQHDVDTDNSDAGDHSEGVGAENVWLPFFSLRFWIFFFTFFGLTGTVLTGFDLAGYFSSLIFSILMGIISGGAAAYSIHWLQKNETGQAFSTTNLLGVEGKVIIPVDNDTKGKIRVEFGGQGRDLIALASEKEDLKKGDTVIILKIENDIAYVTKSNNLLDENIKQDEQEQIIESNNEKENKENK